MEVLFGMYVQKKFSLSYGWDSEKNCYIQKEGSFLTYTRNYEQKANVATVKSTLKILPRHNGIIQIKIKGHTIKGHIAYFISDEDSKKGRTPAYTSLKEFITSKKKHMLMFLSHTTPTNTSPSTKGNMWDICNHLQKTCNGSKKIQDHKQLTVSPQKDDDQESRTRHFCITMPQDKERYQNKTRGNFKGI